MRRSILVKGVVGARGLEPRTRSQNLTPPERQRNFVSKCAKYRTETIAPFFVLPLSGMWSHMATSRAPNPRRQRREGGTVGALDSGNVFLWMSFRSWQQRSFEDWRARSSICCHKRTCDAGDRLRRQPKSRHRIRWPTMSVFDPKRTSSWLGETLQSSQRGSFASVV